jgi:hypothetical protein
VSDVFVTQADSPSKVLRKQRRKDRLKKELLMSPEERAAKEVRRAKREAKKARKGEREKSEAAREAKRQKKEKREGKKNRIAKRGPKKARRDKKASKDDKDKRKEKSEKDKKKEAKIDAIDGVIQLTSDEDESSHSSSSGLSASSSSSSFGSSSMSTSASDDDDDDDDVLDEKPRSRGGPAKKRRTRAPSSGMLSSSGSGGSVATVIHCPTCARGFIGAKAYRTMLEHMLFVCAKAPGLTCCGVHFTNGDKFSKHGLGKEATSLGYVETVGPNGETIRIAKKCTAKREVRRLAVAKLDEEYAEALLEARRLKQAEADEKKRLAVRAAEALMLGESELGDGDTSLAAAWRNGSARPLACGTRR